LEFIGEQKEYGTVVGDRHWHTYQKDTKEIGVLSFSCCPGSDCTVTVDGSRGICYRNYLPECCEDLLEA